MADADELDAEELKAQISSQWLGKDGVCAVGVELEDRKPVVVISLTGDDADVIRRLKASYANAPVRIRPAEGPIQALDQ
jgi:hypothetical protein